jgi:Kindlin-2 N-terminal domain
MMTNNGVVDGSWELTITVTDLQTDKTLRVKGDLHIGGVMLRLVDALGKLNFIDSFTCTLSEFSMRVCFIGTRVNLIPDLPRKAFVVVI